MDLEQKLLNKINNKNNHGVIDTVEDLDFSHISDFTRGIEGMPEWLGLFDKRDLVVLAGYPSCGKTEFTYFVAKANARRRVKTLYISLELKPKDLFLRNARKKAGVNKLDRQQKNFGDHKMCIIDDEFNKLRKFDNMKVISFEKTPDVEELERTMDRYRKEGYELFFIDNLGKIGGPQNENDRFDHITSSLQNYKNNNDVCIWLLHHLSKPMKGSFGPGGVAALRGSQKIIDNSSLIFELYRDLDPDASIEDKKKVDLILYKDTMDGATGSIPLKFNCGNYLFNKDPYA